MREQEKMTPSMTENAAPSNFVSQLLDHVQRHGKSGKSKGSEE